MQMATEKLVGLNPNQVPRNRDLGSAAYVDAGQFKRDGSSPEAAAYDSTELWRNGITQSGWYWLKGWGGTPYRYWVNNTYKGGRWINVLQIPTNTTTPNWNVWDGTTIVNPASTEQKDQQARPANIFSHTPYGHDLELMCTITISDVEYSLGAIWRNIDVRHHLNSYENNGQGGNNYTDENTTESSGNGYTFFYHGVPDQGFHVSGAWEWCVAGSGGGNVGDYDRNSAHDGGWILHGSGGNGSVVTRAYGYTDQGFLANSSNWEVAKIYVRNRVI